MDRRRATFVVLALLTAGVVGTALVARSEDPAPPAEPELAGSTTTSTSTTAPAARRGDLGNGTPITIAFAGDMNFEGVLRTRLDTDPTGAVGPFADIGLPKLVAVVIKREHTRLAEEDIDAFAVGGRRVGGEAVIANLVFFRQLRGDRLVPENLAGGFVDGDEVPLQIFLTAA